MPIRHTKTFQSKGEERRCPTDLHGKLRDPRCRVQQKPFEPHNKPKPEPKPDPNIPITPIKPGPKPGPGPKPDPNIPITPVKPPVNPPINPPAPEPSGGGSSFTNDAVAGLIVGGELTGSSLGAGAGILARRGLIKAYNAKMKPTEEGEGGEGEGGETEMTDINYAPGAEGEPPIMDEPVPDTSLPKPAGNAQDMDAEFDPPDEVEGAGDAGEDAGDAVLKLAKSAGGDIEMGEVDSDAVNISLDGAGDTADATDAVSDATQTLSKGVTSFGDSVSQMSSNAVKMGARALQSLKALKPTAAADDVEMSQSLLGEADTAEEAAETTASADADTSDILGNLAEKAFGTMAEDAGAGAAEGGVELTDLAAAAGEEGAGVEAASGATDVAAAAAAEISGEAAAAGAAEVTLNTGVDVAAAEAAAALGPDEATFGAAAGVAAAVGAAAGAAAAGGILASVIPAFIAAHKQKPSATVLTSSQETASIKALQDEVAKTPSVQSVITMANKAVADGRPLYSVYDGTNTTLVAQLSSSDLAQAAASYKQDPNTFKGVSPQVLTAMGLNPALSNGVLPKTIVDNAIPFLTSALKAEGKTVNQANLATIAQTIYPPSLFPDQQMTSVFNTNVSTPPTDAQVDAITTANQTTASADQSAVSKAKANVATATANVATAKANALEYNNTLSTALKTEYINEYVNTVDSDRASGATINTGSLINPNSLYNTLAITGGGGTAPTTNLQNVEGLTFVKGQPVFSSQLEAQANAGTNTALTHLQNLQTTNLQALNLPTQAQLAAKAAAARRAAQGATYNATAIKPKTPTPTPTPPPAPAPTQIANPNPALPPLSQADAQALAARRLAMGATYNAITLPSTPNPTPPPTTGTGGGINLGPPPVG